MRSFPEEKREEGCGKQEHPTRKGPAGGEKARRGRAAGTVWVQARLETSEPGKASDGPWAGKEALLSGVRRPLGLRRGSRVRGDKMGQRAAQEPTGPPHDNVRFLESSYSSLGVRGRGALAP